MSYWLIVPAAGGGRRFGDEIPKQFAALAGRTVIEWALAPFLADERCVGVVVALPAADSLFARLQVARDPRVRTLAGGSERSDSVRLALAALPVADADWVLVHDAARPCVAREEIDSLLAEVKDDPVGGVLAMPVVDTVKLADAQGRVDTTVERAGLWRALTPQVFRAGLLRSSLAAASGAGRIPTDESQAVEWMGHHPLLVPGNVRNIKVTQAGDLALAEAMLMKRGALS